MILEDRQAPVFELEDFDFFMFLGVPMTKTGKKFSDEGNTLRIIQKKLSRLHRTAFDKYQISKLLHGVPFKTGHLEVFISFLKTFGLYFMLYSQIIQVKYSAYTIHPF